ncbi:Deoxyribonuclease (DNase) II [Trichuris trichiura]|uniref:Deoxyribonuclease (DNase) II n=1 Tax=Trichuris trichiura TaxID=36087 RepID=A0A077Z9T0_TRITR|nr:Deoxyribonuclease (DNase) II [Trichuris trichiura]
MPRMFGRTDGKLKYGTRYLYMDKKTPYWRQSFHDIDDPDGALGRTLEPLYEAMDMITTFYMMYNDAYPNGTVSWKAAHSKGVLAFSDRLGFWLIHSVPKFPPPTTFDYPNTGKVFGQTLLCITFNLNTLKEIGEQLYYNSPGVYAAQVPLSIAQRFPVLVKVLVGEGPKTAPFVRLAKIRSAGGEVFHHFAKSKKWGKELYSDLVAPSLKIPLLVETWQRGTSTNLPSNCTEPYYVENVKHIRPSKNFSFPALDDHSKWAVADQARPFVCIGDINRQKGQINRGGGTVCFNSRRVWEVYRNSILDFEECPLYDFFSNSEQRRWSQRIRFP